MGNEDALIGIRAGLCERIDAIAGALSQLSIHRLCEQVDAVRVIAQEYGFVPLAQLARALETTMALGDRGAMVLGYLDLMRDAAGCQRLDPAASEAYLAAASVRLAG